MLDEKPLQPRALTQTHVLRSARHSIDDGTSSIGVSLKSSFVIFLRICGKSMRLIHPDKSILP